MRELFDKKASFFGGDHLRSRSDLERRVVFSPSFFRTGKGLKNAEKLKSNGLI